MILCAMLLCSIAHSIICTVRLFRGKMHSDWINGVEILQGRWQHGEKVGYCYPISIIAHSIICTRLFRGKMHSDWFNGIEILQGRWQHGEKVGYCYPSGLEKTLCTRKWDMLCPVGHERVKTVVCTMRQILREKDMGWFLMDHRCDCIALVNMAVNNRSL